MYSKNDYRYYLEKQLVHSDDFLAHYGIKGMKWKRRKNNNVVPDKIERDVVVPDKIERDVVVPDKIERDVVVSDAKRQRISKNIKSAQERGKKRTVQEKSKKAINAYQDKGKKRTAQLSKYSSEYLEELAYNSKKNNFPKSTVNTVSEKKKPRNRLKKIIKIGK